MKQLFTLIAVLFCTVSFSWSQVAGDTDEILHNFTFDDQLTNVNLDPAPNVGLGSRQAKTFTYSSDGGNAEMQEFVEDLGLNFIVSAIDEYTGVEIPGWVVDFIDGVGDFSFVQVNPCIGITYSIDYGAYYEVNSVGDADIGLDYPVEVRTVYPEENTFGCGHEFTIETYCEIPGSPAMDIQPPFYNLEIGPIIENLRVGISIGVDISLCIGLPVAGECVGGTVSFDVCEEIWGFDIPLPEIPALLNFCEDAFEPDADIEALLGCSLPGEAASLLQVVQDGLELLGSDLGVTFNENHVLIEPPNIPGSPVPEFEGNFYKVTDADLTSTSLDDGRRLNVAGVKTDIAKMSFDALDMLAFIPGFPSTSFDVPLLGSIDLADIEPVFQVDQDMDFEFEPVVHLELDLGVPMAYEVQTAGGAFVSNGNGQVVNLIAGQKIVATYPEALSDPTTVDNEYSLDGDFSTHTEQSYFTSFDISLLELEFLGEEFTLFTDNIAKTETEDSPDVIQDHTFLLDGFQSFIKAPFELNPEYPIIDVDYLAVEDLVNLGGGERGVVYKIIFSNGGDVRLNDIRLDFDMAETYATALEFSVECTASDQVALNGNYDGDTDINLLGANVSLDVGEEATVEILVKVKPEISPIVAGGCFGTVDYYASTIAYGTSPIGTDVVSNIYHCTDTRTADDIIAPVDMGAAVIDELSDYTVYGWDELRFDKPELLSKGNAGSSGEVIFENVSLQDGPSFEIWGDVHCGDTIEVLGEGNVVVDYIQVTEIINIHNFKSSVTVTGAISDNSDCVSVMPEVDLVIPENTSRAKAFVGNNESVYLPPGDYKEVRLRTNSDLLMTSGVYNIDKWSFLGDGATVRYAFNDLGPIIINLNTWQALNRENLSLAIDGEGSTEDIMYNYVGVQKVKFHSSLVQGTILAPNADVEFAEGSSLEGACYAKSVNFKTGSDFTGHKFLEDLNINPDCQGALAAPAPAASRIIDTQDAIELRKVAVYPNPFNTHVNVDFKLDAASEVELTVYDLSGRTVYSQSPQNFDAGNHQMVINSRRVFRSGMYIINLRIGEDIITSRIIRIAE